MIYVKFDMASVHLVLLDVLAKFCNNAEWSEIHFRPSFRDKEQLIVLQYYCNTIVLSGGSLVVLQ